MNILINPKFEAYRPMIEAIPVKGFEAQHVFCNRRNLVALTRMGDRQVVVKRYKRPTLANCVIYTWFRKNKARRAYDNAVYLLCHGVRTPEPVAYIVEKRHGFVHTCYFISTYLPWPTLKQAYEQAPDEAARRLLEVRYMEFAHQLHQKKILLRDNNAGNTLVSPSGKFALVDINRLSIARRPSFLQLVLFYRQLGLSTARMARAAAGFYHLTARQLRHWLHINTIAARWHTCKHAVKGVLKRMIHRPTPQPIAFPPPVGRNSDRWFPVREGSR